MKHKHIRIMAGVVFAAFLCGSSFALAQIPPDLKTAKSFAVLGGSTVTNTGSSLITGDLGVSPGTAVTGFPPGVVVGTIYAAGAVAAQAQSDVTTAYNALASQGCTGNLTGQDLGGKTLTAGVYCFSSSAQLTGTLTLDGQGDPNAVFIFQIGSTLKTANNAAVFVTNGALSCNAFWQVGSSATIGTTTAFAGNIIALTSITLNTGASLSGRALARNGAVTLDTNSVSFPDCPIPPVCLPITISPATLPNGQVGVAYSQTITASGGTAPYTYKVVAGSLPPGLTLTSAGVLSGVPTTAATYSFTIRGTDSKGCFANRPYTMSIAPAGCPPITILPATLPNGVLGVTYSQTITGSGGTAPYTFKVTAGSLPTGLTLTAAGVLSGKPVKVATFSFTIRGTDSNGCFGDRAYTMSIGPLVCPPITISPATLPNGVVGVAYSQTITASGGTAPYTFTVTAGSLPPGLILASGGLLSGKPTTAATYSFTIRGTDSKGCFGIRAYTMLIAPAVCPPITISPATLPNGVLGVTYSQTITGSGGTAPYTFKVTAGSLPTGLTLTAAGVLSGKPTKVATFSFTIRGTDSKGCFADRAYTISIAPVVCPPITILPATLPNGRVGVAYSQTITASGGTAPHTFKVMAGSLPPGLTLTSAGVLSGKPTTAATFSFTIRGTDSKGCFADRAYTMSIAPAGCPPITISPATLPYGVAGVPYSQTITASGGTAPYTFKVTAGSLPPGLTLTSAGLLSGEPTTAATYSFTIRGTDSKGCFADRAYDMLIAVVAPTVSPVPTLPQAFFFLLALGLTWIGYSLLRRRHRAE